MIGPIKGEISMAPMITAVELIFNPKEAMKIAKINIHSCAPWKLMELSTFSIVVCSSSLSALILKYFFSNALFNDKHGHICSREHGQYHDSHNKSFNLDYLFGINDGGLPEFDHSGSNESCQTNKNGIDKE